MPRTTDFTPETELKILLSIADFETRAHIFKVIQRKQKITQNKFTRILNYLQNDKGFILKIPKSFPQSFELTTKGRQRLKELRNVAVLDDPRVAVHQKPLYSLDNYSVKYPIVKPGDLRGVGTEVQLNNFIQKILYFENCTVRVNGQKSITIELKAQFGQDPDGLLHRARAMSDQAAAILDNTFGFVVGVGQINKNFSLEVATPEIMEIHKDIGYVKDYMDASKMKGELVFSGQDPENVARKAKSWLEAPGEISDMKQELRYLHETQSILIGTVTQLIHSIGDQKATIQQLMLAMNSNTAANLQAANTMLAAAQEPHKEQERKAPKEPEGGYA